MSGVVKAMDSAMKSMNLEKISNLMDRFEKDFEDLDVQTSVMEGAMNQTTATNVPTDAVENLMKQAADEAGNDYFFSSNLGILVNSFLKQCSRNLHSLKTRSFHQNYPS